MSTNVLALSYLFPNRAQPGYGVFVLNRLRALREFCDIKVIAPIQWYPFLRAMRGALWAMPVPARETIEDLDVFHPRFVVIPRYWKWLDAITYFWAVRSVVKELARREQFRFDLIDVHWTYPDIVAAYWLARSAGKKFSVTVRGHEALYAEERTIRRWLVARYLRRADSVVTLSAELRDRVLALGVAPGKVRVVLNGVDQARFHPLDRSKCRTELGISADKRIIISVGRLTAGKGHQEIIRSVAALGARHDIDLYVIGGINPEEDFGRQLTQLVAELGLRNVHFVDRVSHDRLAVWYGAADVFCLASAREGCPNVVLESLACGTPVVATDVGAVAEVVADGENGYLVQLDDPDSLTAALGRALERSWNRDAISARMQQWGWARCADEIRDIYASLTSHEAP
jgi:glycosyltransferase involved in cell wall biosynthesis